MTINILNNNEYHYTYNFFKKKPKLDLYFLFYTPSGIILLINTIVFVLMIIYEPSSFIFPSLETLHKFSAKSPSYIIAHQYWVFITSIFIHIGIIHFLLNSIALIIIGPQIEYQVGPILFIIIYIISGIFGNILSTYFYVGVSAGASGALFGLLGVGLYFERKFAYELKKVWGIKLRKGPYTSLIIINIILGFIISSGKIIGVDNAAHIGGTICGFILTFVLYKRNFYLLKFLLIISIILSSLLIIKTSNNYEFYQHKINTLINKSQTVEEKLELCNLGIRMKPDQPYFYFKKIELLITNELIDIALKELQKLNWNIQFIKELESLIKRLENQKLYQEATILKMFLETKILLKNI